MQSKNQFLEDRLPKMEEENKPLGCGKTLRGCVQGCRSQILVRINLRIFRKLIRRINLLEKVAQNEQVFTSKLTVSRLA